VLVPALGADEAKRAARAACRASKLPSEGELQSIAPPRVVRVVLIRALWWI
jgi:hypothetical protein